MLNLDEKIEIFKAYLEEETEGHVSDLKDEIHFCFFVNGWDLKFLNDIHSKEEIIKKIELVVSKMILHEHEDGLEDIMLDQFYGEI